MSRVLANIGLLIYVLIAAVALLWWAPNFFVVNLHLYPEASYRYIAASGIPMGLLMMTIAARQSLLPRFRLGLMLEAFAAGLMLILGLYSFYYDIQSVFFCAMHVFICAFFSLLNYYGYRRELTQLDRALAAAKA